jgi:hypothetical protein
VLRGPLPVSTLVDAEPGAMGDVGVKPRDEAGFQPHLTVTTFHHQQAPIPYIRA